jgi:hypothetical protein
MLMLLLLWMQGYQNRGTRPTLGCEGGGDGSGGGTWGPARLLQVAWGRTSVKLPRTYCHANVFKLRGIHTRAHTSAVQVCEVVQSLITCGVIQLRHTHTHTRKHTHIYTHARTQTRKHASKHTHRHTSVVQDAKSLLSCRANHVERHTHTQAHTRCAVCGDVQSLLSCIAIQFERHTHTPTHACCAVCGDVESLLF